MLLRRWMPAAALAALLALSLGACTPGDAVRTPGRTAVATPLFTSDDEALKAATNAYAAYLKMSDTISHDGGAHPERIKPYVTQEQYQREKSGFTLLTTHERNTTGHTGFDSFRVSSIHRRSITAYSCVDVSEVRVLDSTGTDVTPTDRVSRMPFQLVFSERASGSVVLARSETWSGKDFC